MKKNIFSFLIIISICFSAKAQDSLKQYVARYTFPEGSVVLEVDIILKDSGLVLTSVMGEAPIKKSGEDIFSIPSYNNGTIWFLRNEAKKINGIKIEALGAELEGNKEENSNINFLIKFPPPLL